MEISVRFATLANNAQFAQVVNYYAKIERTQRENNNSNNCAQLQFFTIFFHSDLLLLLSAANGLPKIFFRKKKRMHRQPITTSRQLLFRTQIQLPTRRAVYI